MQPQSPSASQPQVKYWTYSGKGDVLSNWSMKPNPDQQQPMTPSKSMQLPHLQQQQFLATSTPMSDQLVSGLPPVDPLQNPHLVWNEAVISAPLEFSRNSRHLEDDVDANQPKYSNIPETLQNDLPEIDEAGYASLIVTPTKPMLTLPGGPTLQTHLEEAEPPTDGKGQEPAYQELEPFQQEFQKHQQSCENLYQNTIVENGVMYPYPDLLKTTGETENHYQNDPAALKALANEAIDTLDDADDDTNQLPEMYAKVDPAKKQQDRLSRLGQSNGQGSVDSCQSDDSPVGDDSVDADLTEDEYARNLVGKFTSYFAQALEGEEQPDDLRVSHC